MAKKRARGGAANAAAIACPPVIADPLAAFDLTESERAALLAALRRIVRHFVDLAFEGDALLCLSSSEHHRATAEEERQVPPDPRRKGENS